MLLTRTPHVTVSTTLKGSARQTVIIKFHMNYWLILALAAGTTCGSVAQDPAQQQLPTAPSALKYPPPPPPPAPAPSTPSSAPAQSTPQAGSSNQSNSGS